MKSKIHSDWIDILRGLSAFAVVLFHVRVDLWVGWQAIRHAPEQFSTFDRACAWLSIATPFMGSAVMLFFLISGFCVHLPYAAKERPFELASYSHRRFFRIYPPYLLAVVLSILVELALKLWFRQDSYPLSRTVRSVFMIQNYGANPGQMRSNASLWSLPVEMELYIAYPLFLWLLTQFRLKWSLITAGVVSFGALLLSLKPTSATAFFHPMNNFALYWIIWCIGAAFAEFFKTQTLPQWRWWHTLTLGVVGVVALGLQMRTGQEGLQHWAWGAFYALVLLWGLTRSDAPGTSRLSMWWQRIKKPLIQMGTLSYSLYLIHFPIFVFSGAIWERVFGSKPANFLVPLGFCFLVLPISYGYYRYVEIPSHNLARKLGNAKKYDKRSVSVPEV